MEAVNYKLTRNVSFKIHGVNTRLKINIAEFIVTKTGRTVNINHFVSFNIKSNLRLNCISIGKGGG